MTEQITKRPTTFSINMSIDGQGHVTATAKEARETMMLGVQAPDLDQFFDWLRSKILAAQAAESIADNVPIWEPPW